MPKLTKAQLNEALNNSIRDGAATRSNYSIYNSYLTPFALFLGANPFLIGLVNSIPKIFAGLSQATIRKFFVFGNDRSVDLKVTFLSRIVMILLPILAMIAFPEGTAIWILIGILAWYHFFRAPGVSTWLSWTSRLVPKNIQGRFFAKRESISSIAALITMLISGYILSIVGPGIGFTALFTAAFLIGLISLYYLKKVPDTPTKAIYKKPKSNRQFISELYYELKTHKNFRRFAVSIALISITSGMIAPFTVVYMLEDLGISYGLYSAIVAFEIAIAIFSQPYWGKLMDTFGDKKIMYTSLIFILATPLLWAFSSNIYHIFLLVIITNFGWAGFALSTFNYLIDVTPKRNRVLYVSNYSIITGAGEFIGPIVGGFLALMLVNVTIMYFSGLQILFLLTFLVRLLVSFIYIPHLREMRTPILKYHPNKVPMKILSLRLVKEFTHDARTLVHYVISLEKRIKGRSSR